MRLGIAMVSVALLAALQLGAQPREQLLINNGWTFHPGDVAVSDPSDVLYDDSSWQKVNLPHDGSVDFTEGPGFSGGWYRYGFNVNASDKGRHIEVRFDGISGCSEVLCNGVSLGRGENAYVSRVYDLTPYLDYGGRNVLSVRIGPSLQTDHPYEGAGICRDVYLIKTSPVYVPQFTTRICTDWGRVEVDATVANRDYSSRKDRILEVFFRIEDSMGYYIAASERTVLTMSPYSDRVVSGKMVVDVPHMWDFDDPYLYRLHTYVYEDDRLLDESVVPFGIRDFEYHPDRGFLFNNRKVNLLGVNLHQDAAGVGAAIPRELWRYRLSSLKNLGVVAVRCPEGPASPALLDLCDEMGILVIEESTRCGSVQEGIGMMSSMIRRDVNHPSVMLWGIGVGEQEAPYRYDVLKMMSMTAARLDPGRKTIYACNGRNPLADDNVVNGYVHMDQSSILSDRITCPEICSIVVEEPADGIENGWSLFRRNSFLGGIFFSDGFDFRGSRSGLLDYCGFPKDEAYYLEVQGTKHNVLHICPAVDGQVRVYSNCNDVALSADGKSLGRKHMQSDSHQSWMVSRNVRKISAKGYLGGRSVKDDSWPGVPAKTSVRTSRNWMEPDGQDVVVLDISSPEGEVGISVTGPCEILGWGNGDPELHNGRSYGAKSTSVKSLDGKAQVLLRSVDGVPGNVLVYVSGIKKPLEISAYGRVQAPSSK